MSVRVDLRLENIEIRAVSFLENISIDSVHGNVRGVSVRRSAKMYEVHWELVGVIDWGNVKMMSGH